MSNPFQERTRSYRIEVAGTVTILWDERLENWKPEVATGYTTNLIGAVRDQTELYGVLGALRNMGLTLLRVEPIGHAEQIPKLHQEPQIDPQTEAENTAIQEGGNS